MGSGGVGFPLGLRRLTGLNELGFLDPPAPPAACVVWESGVSTRERAVPSGASSHRSGRCARRAAARTGSNPVCVYVGGRGRGGGSVSVARALIVVARRLPFEEENNAVVVVAGSGRGKKEESAGGGGMRTSGPTPVSESDIEAVEQMCGVSRVFSVRRGVWVQQVHVEVRKGKEHAIIIEKNCFVSQNFTSNPLHPPLSSFHRV